LRIFICQKYDSVRDKMKKRNFRFTLILYIMLLFIPFINTISVDAAAKPVDYSGRIISDGRVTAVIDDDHNLWMWGGSYGNEPQHILTDAAYVTLGGTMRTNFAVIKTDDSLWILDEWSDVPSEPALNDVCDVWLSSNSWLALKKDGSLWKSDEYDSQASELFMSGVVSAFITDNHLVVLKDDGAVIEWYDYDYKGPVEDLTDMADAVAVMSTGGSGSYKLFQLKDDSLILGRNTHITDVASFDVATNRIVVVKSDNTLWEWNFGKGDIAQTMTGVIAASTSTEHTTIIKTDGTLWLAGDREFGLSGLGYNREWSPPEKVMDDVIYAAAAHTSFIGDAEGFNLILAVKSDGSIWVWGNNASNQVPNGGIYDVGDEYDNYVISPCEVKGINLFGSAPPKDEADNVTNNEDVEIEKGKSEDPDADGNKAEDAKEAGFTSDVEKIQKLVSEETEKTDSGNKKSTAPAIAGILSIFAVIVGGAVLFIKRRS
jgi:hypothetical protein